MVNTVSAQMVLETIQVLAHGKPFNWSFVQRPVLLPQHKNTLSIAS